MRWLVMGLVVANLVMLYLQVNHPRTSTPGPPELPAGVAPLQPVSAAARSLAVASATEVTAREVDAETGTGSSDAEQSTPPQRLRSCFTVGPYRDGEVAEALAQAMDEAGLEARRRTAMQRVSRGYWVYVPPMPSREAAQALSRQLGQRGVKDYFVVQEGDKENAVSLGVFSQKRYADRRVGEMERLGYNVTSEPIFRERTVHWLDFETEQGAGLPADLEGRLSTSDSGVERLGRACE